MERFLRVALTSLGPGRIKKEVAAQPALQLHCGSDQKYFGQIHCCKKKGKLEAEDYKVQFEWSKCEPTNGGVVWNDELTVGQWCNYCALCFFAQTSSMSHTKTCGDILGRVTCGHSEKSSRCRARGNSRVRRGGAKGGSPDLWFCSHAEQSRAPRGFSPPPPPTPYHSSKVTARTGSWKQNQSRKVNATEGKNSNATTNPPHHPPTCFTLHWYPSAGGKKMTSNSPGWFTVSPAVLPVRLSSSFFFRHRAELINHNETPRPHPSPPPPQQWSLQRVNL